MLEERSPVATLFHLGGKNAVVTGGSKGIGKEIAQLFLAAGANVMIVARDAGGLEYAVRELESTPGAGKIRAFPADVSDEQSVIRLMAAVEAELGGLDILINNAGSPGKYPLLETTAEQWDEAQRLNLRSQFLCLREAARVMKKNGRGGSIVNISSISSRRVTVYDNAPYGSAKAGVNQLTRNAASELIADGIRVNAVLPGAVATEGARSMSKSGFQPRGPILASGRMPLQRAATPREIAAGVLYLASPAAAYVNGQLLVIDGGYEVT